MYVNFQYTPQKFGICIIFSVKPKRYQGVSTKNINLDYVDFWREKCYNLICKVSVVFSTEEKEIGVILTV